MDIEVLKGLMWNPQQVRQQMERHNIRESEREEFYKMHEGEFEIDAFDLFVWLGY